MTTLQSRVANVIDVVVAGMRITTGYRSPSATASGFVVFDGPELYLHEMPEPSGPGQPAGYIVIGFADDPEDPAPTSDSDWAQGPMGPQHSRDEVGTITCLASFSTGDAEDGSVSVARLGALGLMADVANYCRIDPSLGLDTSGVVGGIRTRSFVTAGQMSQYLMGGVTCDWLFTITFQARV